MSKKKSVVFASPVDVRPQPQGNDPQPDEAAENATGPVGEKANQNTTKDNTPEAEAHEAHPAGTSAKPKPKKSTPHKRNNATTQQRNNATSRLATQQRNNAAEQGDDQPVDWVEAAATGTIDPDRPTKQLNNRVPPHVKEVLRFLAFQQRTSEQQLVIDILTGKLPSLPELEPDLYNRCYDWAKEGRLK